MDENELNKHILTPDPDEEYAKLHQMSEQEDKLRKKKTEKELIKNSIEKRVTRSMTKNEGTNEKMNQQQNAIFAIGNLIISDSEKLTLWMIVWKIHQYLPLTQSEHIYWNSFEPKERNFLLTGDEIFSPEIPRIPNNLLKLTRNIEKVIQYQPTPQHNPNPEPIPENIDWEETAADLETEESLNLHLSSDSDTPTTPPPILRTRNAPKKDNGPDCIQSSLFCNVSPHPVKWKPNPNSTAKQKHSSSGV